MPSVKTLAEILATVPVVTLFPSTCIKPFTGVVDVADTFNNAPLFNVVPDPPSINKPLPLVIPAASICIMVPVLTLSAVITTGFVALADVVSRCNNLPLVNAVLPIISIPVPVAILSILRSIILPAVCAVATIFKSRLPACCIVQCVSLLVNPLTALPSMFNNVIVLPPLEPTT